MRERNVDHTRCAKPLRDLECKAFTRHDVDDRLNPEALPPITHQAIAHEVHAPQGARSGCRDAKVDTPNRRRLFVKAIA
jgi:hypothetical protein